MPAPRDPSRVAQQVLLARIHERVHDLLEPSTTRTEQWLLKPPWRMLRSYPHVVEHPSLIDQLRGCFPEGSSGESTGRPGSRPPANITTLSELQTITVDARRWASYAFGVPAGGVVDDLRLLDQRAATLEDLDDLRELDRDVTRWWAHARVATTWDRPPVKPFVPCDQCGRRGGLRVTDEPLAAVCLECGAAWDSATIGSLGEHVRIMLDPRPLPAVLPEDFDAGVVPTPILADLDEVDAREIPSVLKGVTARA